MARRSSIGILRTLGALSLPIVCAVPFRAQMHKVEAPQQVTRAVSVYEWTGELPKPAAARLIPVSLFIDGHFEDAGVYLARPVPFAIETGDVYSIEKAGRSLGTLDIEFARNVVTRRSAADDDPLGVWYGYGRFVPPAPVVARTNLHPSAHPSTVVASNEDSDDTPHFVTRQPSSTTTPSKSSGSAASTPTATANPAPDDDPDRPTLRHRDPADDSKRHKSSRNDGFVTPPNTPLNDDPDRPTLRRGIPAEQAMATQLTGLPPNLHQDVAVSDAANREPHIFSREWDSPTERAETLAGLELAARPRIANYLLTNNLTAVAPSTSAANAGAASGTGSGPSFAHAPGAFAAGAGASATSTASGKSTSATNATTNSASSATRTPRSAAARAAAARRQKAAPAPAFALLNEQLQGYTLSYGGLPTFVYTVEVPVAAGGPVYLTMVAQRLPAGELQVALSSITDAAHLDRTPWMRPIDVVDADASHRASLLFELRAQSSRQFALYRLVTAKAEQIFITGLIE
jgi:hypothetical protein